MKKGNLFFLALSLGVISLSSCKKDAATAVLSKDITAATKVSVDRFSAAAGHLFVRSATNGLPAANAPINFDVSPFITTGFDKNGSPISYYNYDVQSSTPDDIYVFFKSDGVTQVAGQNNVIPTIPGTTGYSDFWIVSKVIVPDSYVPNSLTSEAAILASGNTITKTKMIVNCPVVPFGSTAAKSFTAGTPSSLVLGWYQDQAVAYFTYGEAALTATSANLVPIAPIYVQFNVDPSASNAASGPASGFKTESTTSAQTHNVLANIPGDAAYSPLWNVLVISNTNFSSIKNLATATSVASSPAGANVNCPVIK